ncbi:mutator type transposase, partial [Tanacetum coccineum]
TQEALFSLKIQYAGCFIESPGRNGRNMMYYSFLKPDMNLDTGLYALGNDDDVKIMSEYIRLGYKMIEVYIKHDKTTVFTYIKAAYNTPSKKCVIMEYPEGNNAPQTKLKPRRAVLGNCAKKLLLGWKENDATKICKSSTRHEDGESSQPKTTTDTTQTEFATDFYTTGDPLMGQDFDPFFGLDNAPVDATNTPTTKVDCVGKGKGIALDDGQVDVSEYVDWNEAAEDENRDGDGPWGEVCVVDVQNRSCACRKWEIIRFPCKHAVASNWNMAANRIEVGLPESWVHPCYRLKTWKQVYSHHINPIRGKIMWTKCPIPTTILSPNQHPQVGRPTKARKKSAGEDI